MLNLNPIRREDLDRTYHRFAREQVHAELEKHKYKWADGYKGDQKAKLEVLNDYVNRLRRYEKITKSPENRRYFKIAIGVTMDAISWLKGRRY